MAHPSAAPAGNGSISRQCQVGAFGLSIESGRAPGQRSRDAGFSNAWRPSQKVSPSLRQLAGKAARGGGSPIAGSCYFAHATHEGHSVICWKIEHFIRPIAPCDGDSHRNATCSRISRCFAHATHEDSCVIDWKIMPLIPQERAKTAPFRPVQDDFRQVSIEILYDRALLPAAKAGLQLRLSQIVFSLLRDRTGRIVPCYLAQSPHQQLIVNY